MVCADVLARQGVPVVLRCADPEALGRSFRGVLHDQRRLEVGARLLELDYGDPEVTPAPDPRGYEPGDHRWHMGLIREYLLSLVPNPPEVKLWIDREGRMTPDFLLTSNLHDLPAACSEWELQKIEREALAAVNVLGPDGLNQRTLWDMTYRAASITCHGWAFHKVFVEPLLDRILGPDGDLPAVNHRRVWLPLFTPGEILDACRGQSKRPVRKMHAGMREAVEALVRRVEPLLGASLPPGVPSRVEDLPRIPSAQSVQMRFVWAENPRPGEPVVIWQIGRPIFRVSQFGRLVCWELRADASVGRPHQRSLVADRMAFYPLAEHGRVDCERGLIGVGSFNEQLAQGISAAAWRMAR